MDYFYVSVGVICGAIAGATTMSAVFKNGEVAHLKRMAVIHDTEMKDMVEAYNEIREQNKILKDAVNAAKTDVVPTTDVDVDV